MRERRRRVTFRTKDRYRYTVCMCKRQKQKLHFGEFELLARHICSISLLPIGLMPQVLLDLSDWMHTALIQIITCLNTENANVHTALRHLHSHTANVCTLYSLLFRSSWLHEFMTRKCNFFFTHCCSGANRFACVGVFHISSFFKPKKSYLKRTISIKLCIMYNGPDRFLYFILIISFFCTTRIQRYFCVCIVKLKCNANAKSANLRSLLDFQIYFSCWR